MQVQLGREPALAAAQRLDVLSTLGITGPARAGRVLVGADDSRVHEVQVPVHLAPGVDLRLQRGPYAQPHACRVPTIEPARHRAHRKRSGDATFLLLY